MALFKRGNVWWFKFRFAKRIIRESAKTASKTLARDAEKQRRRELEEGYNNLTEGRDDRVQTITTVADAYLADYKLRHRSGVFAEYALGHVKRHLGERMLVDISDKSIRTYQTARLKEGTAPKTINEEVGFLLRLLGERGDYLRAKLRRGKALKLKTGPSVGRAFSSTQKADLLKAATPGVAKGTQAQTCTRSPNILPALALALNAGMRDAEIRNLSWAQIDFDKRFLTVGRSKTDAGEGRTIPLNSALLSALLDHSRWYTERFGTIRPEWFVFPGRVGKPTKGQPRPLDPTRPITSLKTAWQNIRTRTGVEGRWHDARHTLITELAESGAGDQTIMDIAGHVSRQMLSRYSHIRMEAKRKALEAVGTSPKAAPTVPSTGAQPIDSEPTGAQNRAQSGRDTASRRPN